MAAEKQILIVDDEKIIVDVMKRRFSRMGFAVLSALNGAEAIEAIDNQSVDLVICDVMLPNGVDGEAVLKHVRQHCPQACFVAISGNILSDEAVSSLMDLGADLFVKKPFPSLGEVTEEMAALIS